MSGRQSVWCACLRGHSESCLCTGRGGYPCARCGGETGVGGRVLQANAAHEVICAACAKTMTVDP